MTLLEVMIATVLLTMVLASVFAAFLQGLQMVSDARDQTRASQIIQSQIEALRTENWISLTDLQAKQVGGHPVSVSLENTRFQSEFADRYAITRHIENSATAADQKIITVQVTWTARNGRQRDMESSMVFTTDGLNDYFFRTF